MPALEVRRLAWSGVAFAGLQLAPSVLVLGFGLVGSSGNSFVTAGYIAASMVLLAVLSFGSMSRVSLTDVVFLALCACIVVSFSINLVAAEPKEIVLLVFSLFSYPAARSITLEHLPSIRKGVMIVAGVVVAIGTPFTIWTLIVEWDGPHGKPIVFGLEAAATLFTMCLGFLILGLATMRLNWKSTAIWCAILFLPTAVYAASMVRFSFLAMLGAIGTAAMLAGTKQQQKYALVIALAVVLAICCGLAARYRMTTIYLSYPLETTLEKSFADPGPPLRDGKHVAPSCRLDVNMRNSIAIRGALLRDAFVMIPEAGLFGSGLDSFINYSCLPLVPHNANLQAFVEFGWIGGMSLLLLMVAGSFPLLPITRANSSAAFFFCCLAYVVALSLVHGRLSREVGLFALLGASAGIAESFRRGKYGKLDQSYAEHIPCNDESVDEDAARTLAPVVLVGRLSLP